MKKIILSSAALLFSTSLFAAHGDIYGGVGLGVEAMPKGIDNGFGLAVKAGVDLGRALPHFGMEAELSTSLVAPQYRNDVEINVFTAGLYATYTIAIPSTTVSLRPKFGAILPNLGDEIHSRDIALSMGMAALLKINSHLDAYVEYVNASEMMNNYMLGMQVRF